MKKISNSLKKNITKATLVLSVVIFLSTTLQSTTVLASSEKADDFKLVYGNNWDIVWDEETDVPSLIYGSSYDLKLLLDKKLVAAAISDVDYVKQLTSAFISKNS